MKNLLCCKLRDGATSLLTLEAAISDEDAQLFCRKLFSDAAKSID